MDEKTREIRERIAVRRACERVEDVRYYDGRELTFKAHLERFESYLASELENWV